MRVIIPAAGHGQRFRQAGYLQPKPLISVLGQPMLQHVLQAVSSVDPQPLVLCMPVLANAVRALGALPVAVHHTQAGAALTLLCANGQLPDSEPVLIVDCDNIYDEGYFQKFLQHAAELTAVNYACLLTTESTTGDNWSFVHGAGGNVGYVREKQRISNRITCGANAFPSWTTLRAAICHMVAIDETVNNEFYLVPAVNHLRCGAQYYDIPASAFKTVGTPEALQAFEKGKGACV